MTLAVNHALVMVTPDDPAYENKPSDWNAAHALSGVADVAQGGTGQSATPSPGQVLVGDAGGTAFAPVSISGSGATIILSSAGVVTISGIANASLANSAITIAGTSTSLGGSITQDTITGLASTGIVKRTAANTLAIASAGTDYEAAITAGTSAQYWRGDKTFQTLNATAVGLGSVTNDAQTKAAVMPNTAPTDGQIPIGSTAGGAYTPATITAGSGISVTNAAGGITIAATGGGGGITLGAAQAQRSYCPI